MRASRRIAWATLIAIIISVGETITTRARCAFCTTSSNSLDKIGIDRLRGHEHERYVLRLARQKIALGDVLDVLHDVAAHAGLRRLARLVVARRAQGGETFERKLRVDREKAAVAGQADDAIGPRTVRQRELEVVGARRKAVAHDRLHPPLPEGAARLLVGENVLQRHDLARHFGQPRLRRVDHREALVQLAEVFAGPPGLALDSGAEPVAHAAEAPGKLGVGVGERGEPRLDRLLPLVGDLPLPPPRGRGAPERDQGHEQHQAERASAAASASGRETGTPSMTAMGAEVGTGN